jgi:hypothetical protein
MVVTPFNLAGANWKEACQKFGDNGHATCFSFEFLPPSIDNTYMIDFDHHENKGLRLGARETQWIQLVATQLFSWLMVVDSFKSLEKDSSSLTVDTKSRYWESIEQSASRVMPLEVTTLFWVMNQVLTPKQPSLSFPNDAILFDMAEARYYLGAVCLKMPCWTFGDQKAQITK